MAFFTKAAAAFFVCLLFATISFAQVKHRIYKGAVSLKTSIANGKLVYTNNCLSCHQADGGGVQNMYPPLIKTSYISGNKKKLILIVLNGLHDEDVNGDTYNNVMAAHADLKNRQIADVLTYVRRSFGNKASRVTALEVKRARAANKK